MTLKERILRKVLADKLLDVLQENTVRVAEESFSRSAPFGGSPDYVRVMDSLRGNFASK